MSIQLQPAHRFSTLDALRGVAALLVVQVHLPFLFAGHMTFPNANLAVDFFFMLSGFVLSFAYGERLEKGWPLRHFLRDRIIRLYPLYLLALPLGLARLLLVSHTSHINLGRTEVAVLLLLALLLLPAPAALSASSPYAFPLNFPSWSLFYELFANVLHAAFLRRRSSTRLAAVTALLALSYFGLATIRHHANFGPYRGEVWAGTLRVGLSYTYGMLLFHWWTNRRLPAFGSAGLSTFLLVAVLVYPPLHSRGVWFEAIAILLVFPAAVIFGANAKPHPGLLPLFSILGTTSYAVYVFHLPFYFIYTALWQVLAHARPADHAPFSGIMFLLLLLALAYAADRFYDLPVRRWLKRRSRPVPPSTKTLS